MTKKLLGFGMMRLPVLNNNPTDFNYPELYKMVDAFLQAGFTYFDTSYVYHNGESETAVRKALVERYPHTANSYTIATKFPTFGFQKEEEIEPIFQKQLQKIGVTYIDYYLLHNIQNIYYDGMDGKGGIIKKTHLFEHAKQWLQDGKIKHLGISFHSSAKLLDRVLSEHPEIEFVQLPVNYIDWDSPLVQAGPSCEVVKKHGKKLIIMEPVKGGALAKLPAQAANILQKAAPDRSLASWGLRFACGVDNDIITILSGMSSLPQMQDNIKTMTHMQPLNEHERAILAQAIKAFGEARPLPTSVIAKYQGLTYHDVPVSALLDGYSTCQMEPDPSFSCINNYPKNTFLEAGHFDFLGSDLKDEKFILKDGTDVSTTVMKAIKWLKAHSF